MALSAVPLCAPHCSSGETSRHETLCYLSSRPVLSLAQPRSFRPGTTCTSSSLFSSLANNPSSAPRELDWDTYLDKVQGAWMGKMIGVTFGQPWEFNYLGAPIGFDITDWTLSPTRMKDYRARDTKSDKPIIHEADNQQVHIDREFIETSEKEHPSFGTPDNDDIYSNLLFLYCLRHYGINVTLTPNLTEDMSSSVFSTANGDFYKTMNFATRCDQDADCNPASAAGILGALLGAHAIPAEYRGALHNTYWNKTLAGLPDSYEIDALPRDTALVGLDVVLANGGEAVSRNGKLILRIPSQKPVPPATLEQIQWKDDKPVLDQDKAGSPK
jgi:ADP-ribosylglycohydrolase